MQRSPVQFRSARPTPADGRLFAGYLDQAAEGFFRLLLGRRKDEILARAFAESGHDLSYEHVTFAEREGVVVGMVSGYTAEQHRGSSDSPLRDAAGWFHPRLIVVSTLFAPLLRIIDTVADRDHYVQAVAVEPSARGEGVGSALMDWIEHRAIDAGSTRLALDVSGANKGARRFYERRGMAVLAQWPKRLKIPKLKLLRMTKPL